MKLTVTTLTCLLVLTAGVTAVSAREIPRSLVNRANTNVAERSNTNINRPPLNINSALRPIDEIKTRQLALLDRIIAQNTFRQTQVEARTEMDAELKENVLNDLQKEAIALAALHDTVESADTIVELRAAIQDMRTHATERQAFLKDKQAELRERGQKHAETIEAKEKEILEHLNSAVEKLKSFGVDTSAIEVLITEHVAHTERVRAEHSTMDLETLKTEALELQSEVRTITTAIKKALEEAKQAAE